MAFEIKDFFRSYDTTGDYNGKFNVARLDTVTSVEKYYAYINEVGSFIIQQVTTSGTTTLQVYKYYARKKAGSDFQSDWDDRANKTYVEYYLLFNQD